MTSTSSGSERQTISTGRSKCHKNASKRAIGQTVIDEINVHGLGPSKVQSDYILTTHCPRCSLAAHILQAHSHMPHLVVHSQRILPFYHDILRALFRILLGRSLICPKWRSKISNTSMVPVGLHFPILSSTSGGTWAGSDVTITEQMLHIVQLSWDFVS